jgi:RHS repeat-associated protein
VQQAYGYAGRAGCGLGGVPGSGTTDGSRSPHAVTSAAGGTFGYDLFGNQTLADNPGTASDRFIRYTAEQQAHEIALSSQASPTARSRFWYGSDGQRYKREDTTNGAHLKRTLYLGNVEIVQQGGTTLTRRYVAGVLVQELQGATTTNKYLFHDHLGSAVRIASPVGGLLEGMDYGPFGERRGYSDPRNLPLVPQATNRGFTGHEMLDGLDVVHMNGRIYDSRLARFLQPDPFVQEPNNPQNFNRYTYVWNNPLNATDPSGYLGVKERQWLGAIITIVAIVTQQYYLAQYGVVAGSASFVAYYAATGAIVGGITTQSWSGAAWGAFSSAMFSMVGPSASSAGPVQRMLGMGSLGGVMSSLQGGKFGHGFISAGTSALVGPHIGKIESQTGQVMVAAMAGGTISAATGGKFANGAVTAAMSYAFASRANRSQGGGMAADSEGNPDARTIRNGIHWPNGGWRDKFTISSVDGVTYIDLNLTVSYDADLTIGYVDDTIAEIGAAWSVSRPSLVGESIVMRTNLTRIDSGRGDLHLHYWRDADIGDFARASVGGPHMHLSKIDRYMGRAHEFAHNLGFRHQPNLTGSIASYSPNRAVTYQDLRHVARAYGGW